MRHSPWPQKTHVLTGPREGLLDDSFCFSEIRGGQKMERKGKNVGIGT